MPTAATSPPTKKRKAAAPEVRKFNIGRPPLAPDGSVTMNIRMTRDQRKKVDRLGGPAWIRDKIDRAVEKA